jgi:hypothetical protein
MCACFFCIDCNPVYTCDICLFSACEEDGLVLVCDGCDMSICKSCRCIAQCMDCGQVLCDLCESTLPGCERIRECDSCLHIACSSCVEFQYCMAHDNLTCEECNCSDVQSSTSSIRSSSLSSQFDEEGDLPYHRRLQELEDSLTILSIISKIFISNDNLA